MVKVRQSMTAIASMTIARPAAKNPIVPGALVMLT